MSFRIAFGCLLAGVAAAAHSAAQKPAGEPYTAFPKLTAPDGWGLPKRLADRLAAGPTPLPADAPPLTRVRAVQVEEGLTAIAMTGRRIEAGQFTGAEYTNYLKLIAEVFRALAELEPTPAGKVAAFEDRVVVMKQAERFATARVEAGTEPPQALSEARFWRLQAEKELLLLQEELAKAVKK